MPIGLIPPLLEIMGGQRITTAEVTWFMQVALLGAITGAITAVATATFFTVLEETINE